MAVTSSRQWEVFGGAPHSWVRGPVPFVPPLPRCGFSTFPPQHNADTAPWVWLVRNPPFVPPVSGAIAGTFANGVAQTDFNNTFGQAQPFSWVQTTVPPALPIANIKGSAVFSHFREQTDWKAPDAWVRSTVGIPTAATLAAPAARASFQRAGGWWDLLSDAAFFYAAGYALQPPGPPPMKAFAAVQSFDAAPYKFTASALTTLLTPTPLSVTDYAFPPQLPVDFAPYSLTRGLVPAPVPNPPFGISVLTQQLDASTASFTFASGLYTTTAFTPAFVPPRGANAIGSQQPFDHSSYSFTRNGLGLFVPTSTLSQTDYAFPPPQPSDTAPYTFLRSLALQFSSVPAPGSSITTRALETDTAPYVLARALVFPTPVHIAGSVFAKLHDDAAAPFIWTRDRGIKPFIPSPVAGQIFVPVEKDSTSGAPLTHTRNGIIVPNPFRPVSSYVFAFAPDPPEWSGAPYAFLQPTLQWETMPFVGGLLVQQAVFNLVNAGLEVFIQYAYDPIIQYGYVISQIPPAGTVLPPWTVVTITASEGLPPAPDVIPVTVPNFIGMTAYVADKTIFDARLSLGQYVWVTNNATAGTVVSQSPPAGQQVSVSTAVTLTLSMGPIPPPKTVVSPA